MGTATITRERVRAPQVRAETTRSRLIASAEKIFVRDGFAAASIEEIASEAGYTRGAFYANFESKEDLFLILLEHRVHTKLTELRKLLLGLKTDSERLQALRQHYMKRSSDRNWVLLIMEFKLFAIRHPEVKRKLAATYRQLRKLYKTYIGDLVLFETTGISARAAEASLSVLANGLVLENMFDSSYIAEADLRKVLGALFDRILMHP
ncbi:MAG: TetR/AcrR family transcriptional regulator [Acidobacteriaceae bacterium]